MTRDEERTIEQIQGARWGEPPKPGSRLIDEVYRLRRMPIGELRAEDLRLLIGQQEALTIVVPLAVELLERNPLAEGDMFEGDLLTAVLRLPVDYWSGQPRLAARLRTALVEVRASVAERVPLVHDFLDRTA